MEANLAAGSVYRKMLREMSEEDIQMMNPLKLAYIGDSAYELFIRSYVMTGRISLKELHRAKVEYVNAGAQAKFLRRILSQLTEEEAEIVRRARNTKMHSLPKNASLKDYRMATALEALVGYWYLSDAEERMSELLRFGLEHMGEEPMEDES